MGVAIGSGPGCELERFGRWLDRPGSPLTRRPGRGGVICLHELRSQGPDPPFLEKLRQETVTATVESRLGASAGVGGYVETLTRASNRIASVYVVEPLLVRVERGTKVLRTSDRVERFGSGALVVVNAGVSVDVENLPDGPAGKAVCTCLMFAPALVRRARAELAMRNPTSAEAFKRLRDDG